LRERGTVDSRFVVCLPHLSRKSPLLIDEKFRQVLVYLRQAFIFNQKAVVHDAVHGSKRFPRGAAGLCVSGRDISSGLYSAIRSGAGLTPRLPVGPGRPWTDA